MDLKKNRRENVKIILVFNKSLPIETVSYKNPFFLQARLSQITTGNSSVRQ